VRLHGDRARMMVADFSDTGLQVSLDDPMARSFNQTYRYRVFGSIDAKVATLLMWFSGLIMAFPARVSKQNR
jgi:hypothetical protein